MRSQESLYSLNAGSTTSLKRSSVSGNLYAPPDTPSYKKRSGSPLRHAITGNDSVEGSPLPVDDDDDWGSPGRREPASPLMAVARAASSFMSSIKGSASPQMLPLTDAEIEAQAIREREYSRREAERILIQEAEERRIMEERILAMKSASHSSLPQPVPPFATSTPVTPSGSPKSKDDAGWWQVAKQRLTPTKESLTPAQQIIQETKSKEKESKKKTNGRSKSQDPGHLSLNNLPPVSTSPHGSKNTAFSHAPPSPGAERSVSPAGGSGVSKEPPPLYAKFDGSGKLDVPETLLAIARRFEKLERWTVGHVRALEDRVGDVEKWLVDKEEVRQKAEEDAKKREEERSAASFAPPEVTKADLRRVSGEVADVRDGLLEVKTRMQELGDTVAAKSSTMTYPETAPFVKTHGTGVSMNGLPSTNSRTKLPYPSGDYNSGDIFRSPPNSPPRVLSPTGTRPVYARALSPAHGTSATTPSLHNSASFSALNTPPQHSSPHASPTPNPRKRYTVALGGPLTSPLDQLAKDFEAVSGGGGVIHDEPDSPVGGDHQKEDTIGGTPINLARLGSVSPPANNSPNPRIRAQSTYGAPTGWNSSATAPGMNRLQSSTPPLRPRRKSGSSTYDRPVVNGGSTPATAISSGFGTGKFVDPLLIRRKEKEAAVTGGGIAGPRSAPPTRGKTLGQLVAFFDSGEQ